MNSQWDNSLGIKCCFKKTTAAYVHLSPVLRSHHLRAETQVLLISCYLFRVLLYKVETWTLTETTIKSLEAFEMWVYRRLLKISWVEHIKNNFYED